MMKRKGKPDQPALRILQSANPISRAADLVRVEIGLRPVDIALAPQADPQRESVPPALAAV